VGKFFVALITALVLVLGVVMLASASPAKQKADAVTQVAVEKTVATADVELQTSIESAADRAGPVPIANRVTLLRTSTLEIVRPLKPDKRIDYGDSNRGYREAARVLIL